MGREGADGNLEPICCNGRKLVSVEGGGCSKRSNLFFPVGMFGGKLGFPWEIHTFLEEGRNDTLKKVGIWCRGYSKPGIKMAYPEPGKNNLRRRPQPNRLTKHIVNGRQLAPPPKKKPLVIRFPNVNCNKCYGFPWFQVGAEFRPSAGWGSLFSQANKRAPFGLTLKLQTTMCPQKQRYLQRKHAITNRQIQA